MFWQIMVHGTEYVEHGLRKYEERVKLTEHRLLNKLAAGLDCQVGAEEATTWQRFLGRGLTQLATPKASSVSTHLTLGQIAAAARS